MAWLGPFRGITRTILIFVFISGIVVPFVLLLLTTTSDFGAGGGGGGEGIFLRSAAAGHGRRPLYLDSKDAEELRFHIRELEQIRASVRNELRTMEQQRSKLSKELESYRDTLSRLKNELTTTKIELQDVKARLAKANRESQKNNPDTPQYSTPNPAPIIVLPPKQNVADLEKVSVPTASHYDKCTYPLCFNFARCPLTQPFYVYIYNQHRSDIFDLKYPETIATLVASLTGKHSITSDPSKACIFVALVGPLQDSDVVGKKLQSLSHWNSEGTNHVLIDLSDSEHTSTVLNGVATGRAIVIQSHISLERHHRPHYDILAPPIVSLSSEPVWKSLPPHLPALRTHLLYFQGQLGSQDGDGVTPAELETLRDVLRERESVVIETVCSGGVVGDGVMEGEWALCGTQETRFSRCSESTFALVIGGGKGRAGSMTYTRLIEALRCGAIPVVFGISVLPFDSVIDWTRAAILLPASRFPDVHYITRSMEPNVILSFRRQGRFLWETYFSSAERILDSVMAVIRYKSNHPPPPASEYQGTHLLTTLGTLSRVPSPTFQQNFSLYTEDFWNSPPGPFFMYPLTPFKPGPTSGSQYVDMGENAILSLPPHVVQAGGITGPFFEDYLLGNDPLEQYTIVMLTYQRNEVLVQALDRLKDLSFLNKVVVVWNNREDIPDSMTWPSIGVPVEVIQPEANSLNNRFLPFSNIETEAVLSIDDDVHLRHDEIQFAFRVWRESRDRIVGFPGRFHAWDVRHNSWLYNSNYTCELSMVLMGAAFFHKYYSYLYTHWMPQEIRDTVDRYMNCEDIAMNFLVSHITRKPPLKVTSRWTFRCPGCPDTLSTSDEHFNERHVCINIFTKIYGYMPLLYTQFRVDSILFKTRLPSHLEKCYQFI